MANGLRELLQDIGNRVSGAVQSGYKQIMDTPITALNPATRGNPVLKISAVRNKIPTIKQAVNFGADVTYRPIARLGFEGTQSLAGDQKVYKPTTAIEKVLFGDEELRNFSSPDRPARQLATKLNSPKLGTPLIAAGALLDLAVPGVDDVIRKAGSNAAKKTILKEGATVVPKLKIKPIEEAVTAVTKGLGVEGMDILPEAKRALEATSDTLKEAAKYDFQRFKVRLPSETKQAIESISQNIKTNTVSPLARLVDGAKDIASRGGQNNTVYRNFKEVFGQNFDVAKRLILDPFDAAKGRVIDDQIKWVGSLKKDVVDTLGIKKGSKLSSLVQKFGEKKLTLEELQLQTKDWQKVVDADTWFRNAYNTLLDQVNATRARIYPNNPKKIIPKREDYYRHFQEMAQGYEGLKNIFDTPANISSNLSGISEYVKPKSKYLSLAQKREGDKTVYDAVGGFIDYLKSATYATHIDPEISKFRTLADELSNATADGVNKGKLNNFIEFLQDFSNDLSGKTNPADRWVQKVLGRKTFKVIDWANGRYKANTVMANFSSSLNQFLALPAGVADAGIKNTVVGNMQEAMRIFQKTPSPIDKSNFIKERYFSSAYDKFDEGMVKDTKKFFAWLLTVGDEVGTKTTWLAQHNKALSEGLTGSDAIKFADNATRNIVGGRGIGEVPLIQKSKTLQVLAPFQLEVANQWYVMKDWVDAKQYGKIITFFLGNHLMNNAIETATGNRPSFDPIEALLDGVEAFQEEDNKLAGSGKIAGRVAGEVLSNTPFIQSAIAQFDKLPFGWEKEEVFGQQDPTRFGGGVPIINVLKDPRKLVTYAALPYGGNQVLKTIDGLTATVRGGVYDNKGNLKFAVGKDLGDRLRNILMGQYASPEARLFFDEGLTAFNEGETREWQAIVSNGVEPVQAWARVAEMKAEASFARKARAIFTNPNLSNEQKESRVRTLKNEFDNLQKRLDAMAVGFELPDPKIAKTENLNNIKGGKTVKIKKGKGTINTPKLRIVNSSAKTVLPPKLQRLEAPNIEELLAQADKELQLS